MWGGEGVLEGTAGFVGSRGGGWFGFRVSVFGGVVSGGVVPVGIAGAVLTTLGVNVNALAGLAGVWWRDAEAVRAGSAH